jgi:hypothetical protein
MSKQKDTVEIFTDIYTNNTWRGEESVSGPGSEILQTKIIIKELPILFNDFNISEMIDIPCGDFNWMKNIDLSNIYYIGTDIVDKLLEKNKEKYERNNIHFHKMDLINDNLPKVDLILSRDCLVHFSFKDIFNALDNVCKSQSKYFITTTFTKRIKNDDIKTGDWRPINLEIAPFFLPKPVKIINEDCTENNGVYADKSLALWEIDNIRKCLTK